MKKYIFVLVLLFTLSGCNRYLDVNQLGLVEIMAFTKEEDFKETVSLTYPTKSEEKNVILSSTGTSLGDTHLKLQNQIEAKLYFDQNQILLLNQKIIEENIDDLISFLFSNFKHPTWLIFLCDDCESILKQEKNHVFYENFVKKEHLRSGTMGITSFPDFASYYLEDTLTAYLPYIQKNKEKVELVSLMAFTPQKKWVEFSMEDAKIFDLLKQKIDTLEEKITVEKENLSLSLHHLSTNFQIKDEDIFIQISGTYQNNDITKKKESQIEKTLENTLSKQIKQFLKKKQEENVDLLNLTHLYYLKEKNLETAKEKASQANFKIQFHFKKEEK